MNSEVPALFPNGKPDPVSVRRETISIKKAIRAQIKAGLLNLSVEHTPDEATVGQFIKQYNPKAIAVAGLWINSQNFRKLAEKCDAFIAMAAEEIREEDKLAWMKFKLSCIKASSDCLVRFSRQSQKELSEPSNKPTRTPSFPADVAVAPPVVATQVNVVVNEKQA